VRGEKKAKQKEKKVDPLFCVKNMGEKSVLVVKTTKKKKKGFRRSFQCIWWNTKKKKNAHSKGSSLSFFLFGMKKKTLFLR
jgi:hypothetical protein